MYDLHYFIETIHINLFNFSWGKDTIGYILLHNYPCILAQIVVNCSMSVWRDWFDSSPRGRSSLWVEGSIPSSL